MSQLMTSASPTCFQDSSLSKMENEAASEKGVTALGNGFSLMPSMFSFGYSTEIEGIC